MAGVARALELSGGPFAAVYAEEWAFLQRNSWMASRGRGLLDALLGAGAAVVTYGRRFRDEMIAAVIQAENVPPVIKSEYFLTKVVPKWIVLGGAAAGGATLAFTVGGPGGAAAGGLVSGPFVAPFVRALDT